MNNDQDLDLRVGRWLDAREVPASAERVSDRILATLVTTRQERRPFLRRVPSTRPPCVCWPSRLPSSSSGAWRPLSDWAAGRHSCSFRPQSVVDADEHAEPVSAACSPDRPRGRHVAGPRDAVQSVGPGRRPGHGGDRSCPLGCRQRTVDGGSWIFQEGAELWVQKGAELVLVRVDPQTGRELERFEGIPGFTVAKDGDTVWGFDENGNVVRVDMATGEELASIDVPEQPKQIVLAADAVWVACDAGNALVRIDPETAVVTDTVDVGFGPVELELGFDSLWVRNRQLELVRIDPETGEVLATITGFGMSPSLGLSFGGGYVWASNPSGLSAVDPATNELAFQIDLPGLTFMDSYWIDDSLWVSTAAGDLLLQVDAARP